MCTIDVVGLADVYGKAGIAGEPWVAPGNPAVQLNGAE